jgi:hypothetical protein
MVAIGRRIDPLAYTAAKTDKLPLHVRGRHDHRRHHSRGRPGLDGCHRLASLGTGVSHARTNRIAH